MTTGVADPVLLSTLMQYFEGEKLEVLVLLWAALEAVVGQPH